MYEIREHEWETPRGNAFSSLCREGTNDWNTTHAICRDDEYRLAGRTATRTVVDIGSYIGTFAICVAIDNPLATVLAIEPVPDNVELIERNLRMNGLEGRVRVLQAGVGAPGIKGCEVRVPYAFAGNEAGEHHAFVGGSTLLFDGVVDRYQKVAVVPSLSGADVLREAGDPVDFMKVDCEGPEWEFLTDPALVAVQNIFGEWHHTGGTRDEFVAVASMYGGTVEFDGPEAGPGYFEICR